MRLSKNALLHPKKLKSSNEAREKPVSMEHYSARPFREPCITFHPARVAFGQHSQLGVILDFDLLLRPRRGVRDVNLQAGKDAQALVPPSWQVHRGRLVDDH